MRKPTLIALLVLALAAFSLAAEVPQYDIFGGYSPLHQDVKGLPTPVDTMNAHGWRGSFTYNVNRCFGLTAEAGGQYHTENVSFAGMGPAPANVDVSTHIYTFLFGPKFTKRGKRLSPFAQAGFGVAHGTINVSATGFPTLEVLSDDVFAAAIGAGVDAHFTKHFSLRLGQVDLLHTGFDYRPLAGANASTSQNDFRFSTGMIYSFGSAK